MSPTHSPSVLCVVDVFIGVYQLLWGYSFLSGELVVVEVKTEQISLARQPALDLRLWSSPPFFRETPCWNAQPKT